MENNKQGAMNSPFEHLYQNRISKIQENARSKDVLVAVYASIAT